MVVGLLMKLLVSKKLKFENGLISLDEFNLNLLPSVFVSELSEYYRKEKKLYKLYMFSWLWGFAIVQKAVKEFNLKTPEAVYSVGMDLGEAIGFGLYKTHDYYPGRYTHFVIKNNPFFDYIKLNRKTKEPIDYFIAGSMGGGGCLVHDSVCQNVELKCMAMGSKVCEFLTGTEKELKDRGLWKTAQKRYKLKKLYPIQKDIYENYNEKNSKEFVHKIIDKLND